MNLTKAMMRELRCISATGEPSDPIEWHAANGIWFHARDRVIGALKRRSLITDDLKLTDAGKAALNEPS